MRELDVYGDTARGAADAGVTGVVSRAASRCESTGPSGDDHNRDRDRAAGADSAIRAYRALRDRCYGRDA
jgi:hypothetical protein